MSSTRSSSHSCDNCLGVDPASCMFNPQNREELAHEIAGMLTEAASLAGAGKIDEALDKASLAYEDWYGGQR